MANRNFPNGKAMYTNHTAPVMVDTSISIGATGAVSSFTNINSFIKSIVRTGTGLYTITLADPYQSLIMLAGSAQSPASGVSGIVAVETQNAPAVGVLAAPTVGIKTLSSSDAPADPASGSTISILMYLSNSSLG